jgi:hypothetical protein
LRAEATDGDDPGGDNQCLAPADLGQQNPVGAQSAQLPVDLTSAKKPKAQNSADSGSEPIDEMQKSYLAPSAIGHLGMQFSPIGFPELGLHVVEQLVPAHQVSFPARPLSLPGSLPKSRIDMRAQVGEGKHMQTEQSKVNAPCRIQSTTNALVRGAVFVGTGVAISALALVWAMGTPLQALQSLFEPRPTHFEALLTEAVGVGAWLCLGWCCAVLGLEIAAAVPGAFGRSFEAVAAAVTPGLVRGVARSLIGLGVLAGPLTGGSAMAMVPPAGTSAPVVPHVAVTSPAGAANYSPAARSLDGPTSMPGSSAGVHQEQTRVSTADTEAGDSPPALDRPGTQVLPAASPPTIKITPSSGAELLARAPRQEPAEQSYVVHRGDALWDIAARHLGRHATAADIAREWPRWYAANRTAIGADPDLIRPGQVLIPPGA